MSKRILIINVNWLGDVLFSTPFIRAIRRKYPKAHIACMIVPRVKAMIELNPDLDEIIIYDEEKTHKNIFGKIKLIKFLRSRKFDTAFILHRSFTRALIAYLSGIKTRVGYNTKKRAFLLTHGVNELSGIVHKVDYLLNIARDFNIDTVDKDYGFFINNKNRRAVNKVLSKEGITEDDKLIVINPGGNWDPKRWPKEYFAYLVDLLVKHLDVKVVISGAAKDKTLAKDILRLMKQKASSICGKLSIKELGALMEKADLVISNDSGPMHVAVSVKTPVIALFGPTAPEITGPYGSGNYSVLLRGVGCEVPCYDESCKTNRCMQAITPYEVFTKAQEML